MSEKGCEQRRGEEMSFYCFFCTCGVCLDVCVCVSNAKAQDFCKGGKLLETIMTLYCK